MCVYRSDGSEFRAEGVRFLLCGFLIDFLENRGPDCLA